MEAAKGIVGAVRLERIWESKLRVNFVALTGGTAPQNVEECVRGLERWTEANVPEKDRAQCDVCGGWSDENLSGCPYCNDEGPPKIEAPPTESAPVEQPEAKTQAPKSETVALIKAPEFPAGNSSSAPLVSMPGAKVVATQEMLDREVERFHATRMRLVEDVIELGEILQRIENDLWQQRLESGKPKYKSPSQFVESELGISYSYAKKLIDAAALARRMLAEGKFTRKQFSGVATTTLALIASAPTEAQVDLVSAAVNGDTRDEIDAKVTEIREAKRELEAHGGKAPRKQPGRPRGSGKNQKKRETEGRAKANTIAEERIANPGKFPDASAMTIGLKKATSVRLFRNPATGEPVTSMEDVLTLLCRARIVGINGVNIDVRIVKTKRGYAIKYRATRRR